MGFNVGRSEGLNLSRIWSGFAERGGTQRIGAILFGLVVVVLGFGSIGIGILLNTISYRFRENMRLLNKLISKR